MGNNVNTKNKVGIKDLKKFVIFIIVSIIVIFIIVFVTLLCNKKQEINDNTNISELNIKKYSSEIKENYELEGKKDKFIKTTVLFWHGRFFFADVFLRQEHPKKDSAGQMMTYRMGNVSVILTHSCFYKDRIKRLLVVRKSNWWYNKS